MEVVGDGAEGEEVPGAGVGGDGAGERSVARAVDEIARGDAADEVAGEGEALSGEGQGGGGGAVAGGDGEDRRVVAADAPEQRPRREAVASSRRALEVEDFEFARYQLLEPGDHGADRPVLAAPCGDYEDAAPRRASRPERPFFSASHKTDISFSLPKYNDYWVVSFLFSGDFVNFVS